MKKFLTTLSCFCLLIMVGIGLVGCNIPTDPDDTTINDKDTTITTTYDVTKLYGANITSWYGSNNQYLDTSVNFNFDNLDIADIDKITFELYQNETKLGDAVSEGDNLVTLLKESATYWTVDPEGISSETYSADDYLEVEGYGRILSCAFSTRTEANNNGYWVRSICTATSESVPNRLVVKVLCDKTEYVSAYNYTDKSYNADMVYGATITSWYGSDNQYLDTSVNFNFDNINISDIDMITFELYQGNELLGNAISTGNNLVTLFEDCAQYWEIETDETYLDVSGNRTLSCAFSTRTEANDNGYWVRSTCTATSDNTPNRLIVKVLCDNIEYLSEYIR